MSHETEEVKAGAPTWRGVRLNPLGADAGGAGGEPSATLGAGSGGDDGASGGQTAGGASIIEDGAAASAGQGADGGAVGQGGEAPAGWEAQPLPEGHPQLASGARTWGDVDRMYRSSSEEARRWQQQYERVNDRFAETLLQFGPNGNGQQRGAQGGQGGMGQASPANNWFGFGSREGYAAAMQQNPEATLARMMQYSAQNDPQFQQLMRQQMSQELQPMQQQMRQQQRQAEFEQVITKIPEFAPSHPIGKAVMQRAQDLPWLPEVVDRLPVEFVMKGLAFDLIQQQGKAAETKLNTQRKAAGVARVGAGGSAVPTKGTWEERIRNAAAIAAANGQQVSEEEIQRKLSTAVSMFGPERVYGKK